jgi:hypothetical protein
MELRPRSVALPLCLLALLAGGIAAAEDGPNSDAVGPGTGPSGASAGASAVPAIDQAPVTTEPAPNSTPAPVIEDKRVFGVLPNYRTAEETGIYMPITSKQKLTIATKDTIDYPLFLLGGAFAGLAQLTDEHPLFGQGVEGFAHRYGTAYADQFVGNYMTEGFLPILFHEDPRFFRRGHGPKWGRTWYAATRIFVTKTDSGGTSFNFSEVVGNSIAAGVGNAYYPGERTLWDNLSRLGQELATDSISQVLKEFWPDIKRRYWFHHKDSSSLLPPELSNTKARSGS